TGSAGGGNSPAQCSLAAVQYGVHLNPHPGRSSLMGVMKGMMEYGSGFVVG
ncbi:hypothetical protein QQF64_027348, partial [Cirrhinus molitorella]